MTLSRTLDRIAAAVRDRVLLARPHAPEDYECIYHAAQRYHIAVDGPQRRADYTILNEHELH